MGFAIPCSLLHSDFVIASTFDIRHSSFVIFAAIRGVPRPGLKAMRDPVL
jgi:hypothetical protein